MYQQDRAFFFFTSESALVFSTRETRALHLYNVITERREGKKGRTERPQDLSIGFFLMFMNSGTYIYQASRPEKGTVPWGKGGMDAWKWQTPIICVGVKA
jgi:hypothetical protein